MAGQQHLAELGMAFSELEHMDESALVGQVQLGSQMQSQLLNFFSGPTADTPAPRKGPVDFASWAASPSRLGAGGSASPGTRTLEARAADFAPPSSCYVGPRLEPLDAPITSDWAMKLVWHFQMNPRSPLPARYLCRLLEEAEHHLDVREQIQGAVQTVSLKPAEGSRYRQHQFGDVQLNILGDTHGQLNDVLWIFYKLGVPSPSNRYLVNGDICDRGQFAVEIWALLLAFMCVWPESVSIQRGNHEDRLLNMDANCGGFYEEVLTKYGRADGTGARVYEKFARIFARLPLAGIVDDRIFVVHGGLSRNPAGGFLRMLRANKKRTPEIPGATPYASAADLAFVDAMWSDPQEALRVAPNPRGAGLAAFGPDITSRFLAETGFQMVVRSHQVPANNEGYGVQHNGKLVTVFSASNYCGIAGNTGAVLILRPNSSLQAVTHRAPPFERLAEVIIDPPVDAEATPVMVRRTRIAQRAQSAVSVESAVQQVESSPKETCMRAERMEREVVRAATRLIVEKKQELFQYWEDCDNQKKGFISKKDWEEGMRIVVGDNIPWKAIGRALRVKDTFTKDVDYRQFLSRFRVVVGGLAGGNRWAEQLLGHFFGRLLTLRGEAAAINEVTGFICQAAAGGCGAEARVSSQSALEAFRWVLGSCITEEQAMQLLRTMAAHAGPDPSPVCRDQSVDVFEFLTRLDVVFRHQSGVASALDGGAAAAADGSALEQPVPRDPPTPWVRSVLRHLGRLLWMEDAEGSPKAGSTRMLEVFRQFDCDGDGLLHQEEFAGAVRTLLQEYADVLPEELTAHPATEKQIQDFFEFVDYSGDGVIAYLEFLHAFQPVDRTPGNCLRMDLMEQICTTIHTNKPSLLRTMQVLEERSGLPPAGVRSGIAHGRISRDGLRQTLRSLNASLGAARAGGPEHGAPLTDMQIDILVDHAAFDARDDTLDYQAFLDAFEIVDTAPPAPGEEEEDATPASPPTNHAGAPAVYATPALAGLQRALVVKPAAAPEVEKPQPLGHPPWRFGALSAGVGGVPAAGIAAPQSAALASGTAPQQPSSRAAPVHII